MQHQQKRETHIPDTAHGTGAAQAADKLLQYKVANATVEEQKELLAPPRPMTTAVQAVQRSVSQDTTPATEAAVQLTTTTSPPGPSRPLPPAVTSVTAIASQSNIRVGQPLNSQGAGTSVMRNLAQGKLDALAPVGVGTLPPTFPPNRVEWGLGKAADREYIVVRGAAGSVDWGCFPGVEGVAHSHPAAPGRNLTPVNGDMSIERLINSGSNLVTLFPSAADVRFCAQRRIARHVVHTPYHHLGQGVLGNPAPGVPQPTVDFIIMNARADGNFGGGPLEKFRARVVATDGRVQIWSGSFYACPHPSIGSLVSTAPLS